MLYEVITIEGDLETENDAERIRATGVSALQITTGTACHLDAHMIHAALHELALAPLDLLFIENVGNLVCPASFDLGQHLNVITSYSIHYTKLYEYQGADAADALGKGPGVPRVAPLEDDLDAANHGAG